MTTCFENGIVPFVEKSNADKPQALVALAAVKDPRKFGVAVAQDGPIVRLVEKSQDPPSNLAVVRFYVFSPAIHDVVAGLEPSDRGKYEITDAIQGLIDWGAVVGG